MEKEYNEDNKIETLEKGFKHFGKVTKTEKEFKSLSDESGYVNEWDIRDFNDIHPSHRIEIFESEKVKEFIEKLKESIKLNSEIEDYEKEYIISLIDELAGDKLTKS